jgi:hypothetical protein
MLTFGFVLFCVFFTRFVRSCIGPYVLMGPWAHGSGPMGGRVCGAGGHGGWDGTDRAGGAGRRAGADTMLQAEFPMQAISRFQSHIHIYDEMCVPSVLMLQADMRARRDVSGRVLWRH